MKFLDTGIPFILSVRTNLTIDKYKKASIFSENQFLFDEIFFGGG